MPIGRTISLERVGFKGSSQRSLRFGQAGEVVDAVCAVESGSRRLVIKMSALGGSHQEKSTSVGQPTVMEPNEDSHEDRGKDLGSSWRDGTDREPTRLVQRTQFLGQSRTASAWARASLIVLYPEWLRSSGGPASEA